LQEIDEFLAKRAFEVIAAIVFIALGTLIVHGRTRCSAVCLS